MPLLSRLVSVGWLAVAAAAHANGLVGEWTTERHAARVRIQPCDHAGERLCGTITWLWEPVDQHGRTVTDARNPDPARRSAPLIGLQMLVGFAPAQRPQSWAGGQIYNPEDGRSYTATLTLRRPDVLEVEGCVLVLCARQIWRKLPATCHLVLSLADDRRQ